MTQWSNFAKFVFARTYSRNDNGYFENWEQMTKRVVAGNTSNPDHIFINERELLTDLMMKRKGTPAGRGLWMSGTTTHSRLGGAALCNCWYFSMDDIFKLVTIEDLLMLGGGIGASVEHRFVSKIKKVKPGVNVVLKNTKDADFIVPDSREGWCELTKKILESFFITGKSFSYSTVCIRGAGEPIKGFGGVSSGPMAMHLFVEKVCRILQARGKKHLRPIDVADLICCTGELIVSGNIRRSALLLLGDPWDKEYLKCKRWDLGTLPTERAMGNWSVVAENVEDLHPLFWESYLNGEPIGLCNRKNMQKYGRMGELKNDDAVGVNPCAEATLEDGESCNLFEISLPNLNSVVDFELAATLGFRYAKRVALENYHHENCHAIISKNQRVGVGITGCLARPDLFNKQVLDRVYKVIQKENYEYSKQLNQPESIRTTVIKPSGTLSKVFDHLWSAGIHGGYSRYMIQRVRLASNDRLVPILKAAGYYSEPEVKFDGSLNHNTQVFDFYEQVPDVVPCVDEGWTLQKQLDTLLMAQECWSDQAVSVTVYYRKEEIPFIKQWLADNYSKLKTISFLCHNDHGFKQAPWEAITKEVFEEKSSKLKEVDVEAMFLSGASSVDDCEGGACPIK